MPKRPLSPSAGLRKLLKREGLALPPPSSPPPVPSPPPPPNFSQPNFCASPEEEERICALVERGELGDVSNRSHKQHLLKIMMSARRECAGVLAQGIGKCFCVGLLWGH